MSIAEPKLLFRRYKKEQMEAMQEERDKIAQERAANEKMLEELRQLKAQMEGMQAPLAAPAETPETAAEDEK